MVLYVLTDGENTKIGKTKDMTSRMSAYHTHNARVSLVQTFEVSDEEASEVESEIKALYRDRGVGKGTEWFQVPSSEIVLTATTLLTACAYRGDDATLKRITASVDEVRRSLSAAFRADGIEPTADALAKLVAIVFDEYRRQIQKSVSTPEVETEVEPEHEHTRFPQEDEAWNSMILQYIVDNKKKDITMPEILSMCLMIPLGQINRGYEVRVGKILKSLGCSRRQRRRQGGKQEWYYPVPLDLTGGDFGLTSETDTFSDDVPET